MTKHNEAGGKDNQLGSQTTFGPTSEAFGEGNLQIKIDL